MTPLPSGPAAATPLHRKLGGSWDHVLSHHSRSERQSGPGHCMPPPIFASLHTAGIPLNILGSPCCSRELLETSSSPGVPCPGPCSLTHWQSEDVISRAVSVWPAHRLSQKPGRHWQARHLRHSACRRDVGVCIGFSELRGERAGSPQKPRKAQLGPCLEEQVSKGWRRGTPEGQACSQRCWDGSQRTGPLSLRAGPSIATQSPSTSQQKELPTCLGPRPSAWLQFSCLTQHGQPGLCRGAGLDRAAGPSQEPRLPALLLSPVPPALRPLPQRLPSHWTEGEPPFVVCLAYAGRFLRLGLSMSH